MKKQFEEPIVECAKLYSEEIATNAGVPGGVPGTSQGGYSPD